MSAYLNEVNIIGNLTKKPDVKSTQSGQLVGGFGVATNRKWKDQSGNLQEEAEFHNIVVWGKLAELCGQYLDKGKKIFVKGRLKTRIWEDPDGKKNYRTDIVGSEIIFLSPNTAATAPRNTAQQDSSDPLPDLPIQEEKIEDLPF